MLFQCLYFRERDPQTDPRCTADAVIYSIKNDGVLVFVSESVPPPYSQETAGRTPCWISLSIFRIWLRQLNCKWDKK